MSSLRIGCRAVLFVGLLIVQLPCAISQISQSPTKVEPRAIDSAELFVDSSNGGSTSGYFRLEVSPDGKLLAARSRENTVDLFDAAQRKLLIQLRGHSAWITGMAFSSDSRFLVTMGEGADGKTICWDAATGTKKMELAEGGSALSFNEEGTQFFLAGPGTLKTFSTLDSTPVRTIKWGDSDDEPLAVSRSGSFLVSHRKISEQAARIQINDLLNDSSTIVDGPAELARSAAISSDENWIAAVYHHSQKIYWWNRNDPLRIRFERPFHEKNLHAVTFSPDSRFLIVTSWDNSSSVWDVRSGEQLATLTAHSEMVTSCAFSLVDPVFFTASAGANDHSIRKWDLRNVVFNQPESDPIDFAAIWIELGAEDARHALSAVGKLVLTDDEDWIADVRLLLHLDLTAKSIEKTMQLIDELNSPLYAERHQAAAMLRDRRAIVVNSLRNPESQYLSTEQRYRLNRILKGASLSVPEDSSERRQAMRLIMALEYRKTDSSRGLLNQIADFHMDSHLAEEAAAARNRLR